MRDSLERRAVLFNKVKCPLFFVQSLHSQLFNAMPGDQRVLNLRCGGECQGLLQKVRGAPRLTNCIFVVGKVLSAKSHQRCLNQALRTLLGPEIFSRPWTTNGEYVIWYSQSKLRTN